MFLQIDKNLDVTTQCCMLLLIIKQILYLERSFFVQCPNGIGQGHATAVRGTCLSPFLLCLFNFSPVQVIVFHSFLCVCM